ncbi:hypothetical protein CPC16_002486, partial [Podila verticillata]
IVDMPDQEAIMKAKASQSSLKKRLQQKLMAVHTIDDALQGHHLENTASNPTYVVPVRRSQSEDEDDDDGDEDYEDEDSSMSSKNRKGRQVQMHNRLARAHQPYDDGGGAGEGPSSLASLVPEHEVPHRTQSEIILTGAEHESVPLNVHPPRGQPRRTGDRP